MYSHFQLAKKYLTYYFSASNGKGHGTHSPFIFHFITKVLNDRKHYPEYDTVENLRNQLLIDKTVLTIEDFGAGSAINKNNLPYRQAGLPAGKGGQRSVAAIAKNSAKPKKFGQLLFRIVKAYQPETILELGTSLGITSSYLSLAKPGAKMVTLEGAPQVAEIAEKNFKKTGAKNIKIIQGNFDHTITTAISQLSPVNLAFIDGNHRQQPTENYFHHLLSKINDDSILIFDDIHWSREMEAAWATIKNHALVKCTVDLFFIGIVFFRPEFHNKQHFTIRF
jgi:predicted O-methyltransferase YrrM